MGVEARPRTRTAAQPSTGTTQDTARGSLGIRAHADTKAQSLKQAGSSQHRLQLHKRARSANSHTYKPPVRRPASLPQLHKAAHNRHGHRDVAEPPVLLIRRETQGEDECGQHRLACTQHSHTTTHGHLSFGHPHTCPEGVGGKGKASKQGWGSAWGRPPPTARHARCVCARGRGAGGAGKRQQNTTPHEWRGWGWSRDLFPP